jgi:hypothetical protein
MKWGKEDEYTGDWFVDRVAHGRIGSDFGHTGGLDRVVNEETENHHSPCPVAFSKLRPVPSTLFVWCAFLRRLKLLL